MFKALAIRTLLCATVIVTPWFVSGFYHQAEAQSSAPPSRPKRLSDPDEFYRAPSSTHGKTVLVPIGTTWEGRIDTTISSSRSRPGTAFSITMSSPVLLNGSDVIVPAGSSIIGEVVEAVSASNVPPKRGQNKKSIRGKLRVQVSGLRTPDGVVHPLVASLAGEVDTREGHHTPAIPHGTGIAYMGSSSSFEAVNINRAKTVRGDSGDRRPNVVKRSDLLKDSILGAGDEGYRRDELTIRSLVLKGRDYYIYSGSPLTVRLSAPFKIGVATPNMGGPVSSVEELEETLPPPSRRPAAAEPQSRASNPYESYQRPGFGGSSSAPPAGYSAPPSTGNPSIPADSF